MAVAVLVTGAVASVRNAVHAVGHVRDGYHQITPGTVRTVQLPAGRTVAVYAIWIGGSAGAREFGGSTTSIDRGAGGGANTTTRPPPAPKATVTVTGPGGEAVDYRAGSGGATSTIEINDKSGLQVGEFTTNDAGSYRVLIAFDAPTGGGDTPSRAAITSFSLLSEFREVALPSVFGFLLGMTIILVTAIRRGAAKRRRRQGAYVAPGYAPPLPTAPRDLPGPPDLPGQRGPFL